MKLIFKKDNLYLLRLDQGEDLIAGLKNFCWENEIAAAYFFAIGAGAEVVLSFYNLSAKKYVDQEYQKDLEINGVWGNVAKLEKEIIVHAHGTFADKKFEVIGGHVKKLIISATGEVFLTRLDGLIKRQYDQATGLNLLK